MLRTDSPGIRKSLCAEHCRYGTRELSISENIASILLAIRSNHLTEALSTHHFLTRCTLNSRLIPTTLEPGRILND
jgi:hypothetical protein